MNTPRERFSELNDQARSLRDQASNAQTEDEYAEIAETYNAVRAEANGILEQHGTPVNRGGYRWDQ